MKKAINDLLAEPQPLPVDPKKLNSSETSSKIRAVRSAVIKGEVSKEDGLKQIRHIREEALK